ncbi:MAG: hypothetical protein ACNA77_11390, partial [Opitutales bacterium]
ADGDWENAANWDANDVPVDADPDATQGLGFASSVDDRIVINATNHSPSNNVPTLYATSGTSVTPNVDVINGSAAFSLGSSVSGTHLLNANASVTIGDGDLSNGLASLTYDWSGAQTFIRDNQSNLGVTVNRDGSLNFSSTGLTNLAFDNNRSLHVTLVGGSVNFAGALRMIRNDTGFGNSWFDFTEVGSAFTAGFSNLFADLDAVNSRIGDGLTFRSTTDLELGVRDNGNDTFTVFIIPEPTTALLG